MSAEKARKHRVPHSSKSFLFTGDFLFDRHLLVITVTFSNRSYNKQLACLNYWKTETKIITEMTAFVELSIASIPYSNITLKKTLYSR